MEEKGTALDKPSGVTGLVAFNTINYLNQVSVSSINVEDGTITVILQAEVIDQQAHTLKGFLGLETEEICSVRFDSSEGAPDAKDD